MKILEIFFIKKETDQLNPVIIIPIFIVASLAIRFYYFPIGIPISLDGIDYFMYAISITQNGKLPHGILLTNDLWSILLSGFFYFFNQNDIFMLMNVQRGISIIISVLTVIPVFLLCRKFFNTTLSLCGSALFCFEPHLIQNSLLGITESLFIFLEAWSLNLFYSKKLYSIHSSFVIAGLSSLVRYEGILLLIPLSVIFFLRYRFNYVSIRNYLLSIGLFVITVLPLSILRTISHGIDGLTSHAIGTTESGTLAILLNSQQFGLDFFHGIIQLFVYSSWLAFPLFVILIPLGIFQIFKSKENKILELLLFLVFLSGTGFYAYSRDAQEIRYLFVLLPIFCIVSSYSFYIIDKKIHRKLFLIVVLAIVFSSIIYLEWKKIDYEFERERFSDAKFIINNVRGMNYYEGGKYIKVAFLSQSWPKLLEVDENKKTTYEIQKIQLDNFNSIQEALEDGNNLGLTHLIIIDKNSKKFLDDIFNNEQKYSYLKKIYDSSLNGHNHPLKVFEIDYEKFEQINNQPQG